MQPRRRFVHVFLSALIAFAIGPIDRAAALSDAEFAEAARFRTDFGFDAGRAHIDTTSVSPESNLTYGIPLTPEEAAEMDRRVAIEQKLAPLGAFLAGIPEFGGAYIDHHAGHVLVLGFVGDAAPHAAAVQSLLPAGAQFRMRNVEVSERELRRIQRTIDSDRAWLLQTLGVEVFEVPVDYETNSVGVGVTKLSPEIDEALLERYGSAVRAYISQPGEVTACTSRDNCGSPLRGGVHLFDQGCSNSFFAYAGSTYYTLTAGHWPCALGTHTYQHPNNSNLGPGVNRWWANGAQADSGIVRIPSSQASRRVYITAATYYPMLYIQQRGAGEWQNMTVCLSGRQRGEGTACGQLITIDFSFGPVCDGAGVCVTLANQRRATFKPISGDSGGAVFTGNTAVGIQSSKDANGDGIYGHVTYALSRFGVTLCTTCQ